LAAAAAGQRSRRGAVALFQAIAADLSAQALAPAIFSALGSNPVQSQTVYDLHHGLANALIIGAAMEFNRTVAAEQLAILATTVGAPPTADGLIAWLENLKDAIGLPPSLGAVGVEASQLDCLVDVAIHDVCHQLNPRPCTVEDLYGIYRAAGLE